MEMSFDEIKSMNAIQMDIFNAFIKVCSELGLTYYMIHGSLLGVLRCKGFFPYDDDIDVAMPRKDYDVLIAEGNNLLPDNMFLQSCTTEEEFPLSFSKVRDSSTAFIQPVMKNFHINQGIYIDIFPLDNYPEKGFQQLWLSFLSHIYQSRVGSKLSFEEHQPIWKKFFRDCSVLLCPSYKKAVMKLANLYRNIPEGDLIVITGGKKNERGMPKKWFEDGKLLDFEGVKVNCPSNYKEYLERIYGDYSTYNPAEKYMKENGKVTVSASRFSLTSSYKDF